jgi:NitT/TauT family transport system substrate-binding protein
LGRLFKAVVCVGVALSVVVSGAMAEAVKIKFTLDWKLQGLHAWFYWAKAKGYFAAENIEVIIDQGEGSATTVTRIMSGAYDAGFGDMNAIIQSASSQPGKAPMMVYMIYNKAPFALLTKAGGRIKSLKDLEGTKLAAPAGGATFKLLPLLAKRNGVDYGKIEITQVAPSLQEQVLIQGQVDSAAVFTATSYLNLVALGRDPDNDFRWLFYADFGLDLYSNGVMVSRRLVTEHADAIKGLLRAINRSLKETIENPDAAIDVLALEEPLIRRDIEKRRLLYVYNNLIDTPETRERGLGDVSESRLMSAVSTIATSFELVRSPVPGELFNPAFLPAKVDRALPRHPGHE